MHNKLKTTIEVIDSGNILVNIRNAKENIGRCRVLNYFLQFVSFRPDQLVDNFISKKNNFIVCVLTIYICTRM